MDTEIQTQTQKHLPIVKIIILVLILLVAGLAVFFVLDLKNTNDEIKKEESKVSYNVAYNDGDLDEAIRVGIDFINDFPKDIDGYIRLANAYLQKGSLEFDELTNADKAIQILNEAIAMDSNSTEVYRILGYAYEIKQDYPSAIKFYNQAIDLDANNYIALNARGHAYDLSGNYELAEKDYLTSLEKNPNFGLALVNLARIYIRTGRRDNFETEDLLKRALFVSDTKRNKADIFQILSTLQYTKGNFDESLSYASKAIENDDTSSTAWASYAMSKLALLSDIEDEDKYTLTIDESIEAIENALQINEFQTSAYVAQAILAAFFEDQPLEKELYQDALSVVDQDITLGKKEKEEMKVFLNSAIEEMSDVEASNTIIEGEESISFLDSVSKVFFGEKVEAAKKKSTSKATKITKVGSSEYKVTVKTSKGTKQVYVKTKHGAAYAKAKAAKAVTSGGIKISCNNVSYKCDQCKGGKSGGGTTGGGTTGGGTTGGGTTGGGTTGGGTTGGGGQSNTLSVSCVTTPSIAGIGESMQSCAHVYNASSAEALSYSWSGDVTGNGECVEYSSNEEGRVNLNVTISDSATGRTAFANCPAAVCDKNNPEVDCSQISLDAVGDIRVSMDAPLTNNQCVVSLDVSFAENASYCDSVNIDNKEAIRFYNNNLKDPLATYPIGGVTINNTQYIITQDMLNNDGQSPDQESDSGRIGGKYKVNPGRYIIQCFDINQYPVQGSELRCISSPDIREN